MALCTSSEEALPWATMTVEAQQICCGTSSWMLPRVSSSHFAEWAGDKRFQFRELAGISNLPGLQAVASVTAMGLGTDV